MITPTSVKYDIAKILSKNHRDVIVYDSTSGDVCGFDDKLWPHFGCFKSEAEIAFLIGTGVMDEAYTFIWMKVD